MEASISSNVSPSASSESRNEEARRPVNALTNASLLSKLFFSWPSQLIKTGAARPIQEIDIPEIAEAESSSYQRKLITKVWEEERELATLRGSKPSLHRAILKLYFRKLWYIQPLIVITSSARIGQAISLGKLVETFNQNGDTTMGYFWGLSLVICSSIPLVSLQQTNFRALRMGSQLRTASVALIYSKALRLSSVNRSSTGEIFSLAGVDVERLVHASLFISYLFWAPVEAIAVLIIGIFYLGRAFAAGYVLLFLFTSLQFYLGKKFAMYRSQIAKITDKRVSLLNQALIGIRVMKMNGWENQFCSKIGDIRRKEVSKIKSTSCYRALNEAIYFATNVSVAFVIFLVHVSTGNSLTPKDIFTTFTLINLVQFTMTKFFAYAVMTVSESYVSLKRVQNFLEFPEIEEIPMIQKPTDGTAISIKNLTCNWDLSSSLQLPSRKSISNTKRRSSTRKSFSNHPLTSNESQTSTMSSVTRSSVALSNITLQLEPAHLYCVIGPVGCGKSALLSTLAGEIIPATGTLERRTQSMAYATQDAWIMNGTVRENIMMGKEFDVERYKEIIKACALQEDLNQFHAGDETIVGDRGIQCSGGQRARIGLARALYQDADLVLLDDPLSAVDSKVANLLFHEAIKTLCVARGKCVVLATHQYQLIQNESCILMNCGRVIMAGLYGECISQSDGLLKSDSHNNSAEIESMTTGRSDSTVLASDHPKIRTFANQDNNENSQQGVVTLSTWRLYGKFVGGPLVIIGVLLLFGITQATLLVTVALMGRWSQNENQQAFEFTLLLSCLCICVIILAVIRALLTFFLTIRASRDLHNTVIRTVLRAKTAFFDTNPMGRILNRFSADVGSNDDQLPSTFSDVLSIGSVVAGSILTSATILPHILIALPFLIWYFFHLRQLYLKSSRELKRLEGVARSPMFALMSESIEGIASIRANGSKEFFLQKFERQQNCHSRAAFAFIASSRWLNFRLESINIMLLSVAVFSSVLLNDKDWFAVDPSILGLALMLLLQLTGLLQWTVRQSSEVVNNMVAVERLSQYAKLPSEAPLEISQDKELVWPTEGNVIFQDLTVKYRENLPPSLSNVSVDMKGGQRIGIVGRSGAGKSTIIEALFRLLEAEEGSILIDGVDISKLGLHKLRKNISVIPQTPVLYSGYSLRENLDPFEQVDDEAVIQAITDVQMKDVFDELPQGLNTIVAEGGSNFSVGQRQLLCVARAILQNNRILVLDEPTANVDRQTDLALQAALSTSFPGATIIAIAHRLDTVIEYENILVVGEGEILEFGSPKELLEREGGHFATMVSDTGPSMTDELYVRAGATRS